MNTLAYVDMPALILDLQYQIKYANAMFLAATGQKDPVEKKDFFLEFVHNPRAGRRIFEEAERLAAGNAFQTKLELLTEKGKYQLTNFDVFVMKNIRGQVEGYGLIGVHQ